MNQNRSEDREKKEAEKYDRRAEQILQDESEGELFVESIHWMKIVHARRPYGPYIGSIRALGDLQGKRILELGCGTGWLSVIFCKLGASVDGIDISNDLVEIAEKRANINQIENQTAFQVMSAHRLTYPAETFDFVYGLSILHHVNILECIPEVKRVLKKGGKAVFSEPIINNQFIEVIRRKIPVKIDDDLESPAPPLCDRDIRYILARFQSGRVAYYRFLSSVDRIIQKKSVILVMQAIDSLLLQLWPFRALARQIVIELHK